VSSVRGALPAFACSSWAAFLGGALIGILGGLIGLGGAEFRLPLLIGLFGFVALEAIIVNKATSLISSCLLSSCGGTAEARRVQSSISARWRPACFVS
jgi:uncharacterized membrane protein YfcA